MHRTAGSTAVHEGTRSKRRGQGMGRVGMLADACVHACCAPPMHACGHDQLAVTPCWAWRGCGGGWAGVVVRRTPGREGGVELLTGAQKLQERRRGAGGNGSDATVSAAACQVGSRGRSCEVTVHRRARPHERHERACYRSRLQLQGRKQLWIQFQRVLFNVAPQGPSKSSYLLCACKGFRGVYMYILSKT